MKSINKFSESWSDIYTGDISEIVSIREELKKYNMIDFLARVSSLMLVPENQSKSIIFQTIIGTALSLKSDDFNLNNIMSNGRFRYFLDKFYNLGRSSMVDPPEFPFCLPVMYYDNYYLFMGIDTFSPTYLNYMLKIYSTNNKKIDSVVYKKTDHIVKGLLRISTNIYKKIGIDYMNVESVDKDSNIKIMPSSLLKNYASMVRFDENEIIELLGEEYDKFVIRFGDVDINELVDMSDQKIFSKPFIKFGTELVLLDVTTFLRIILEEIIRTSLGSGVNIVDEYNKYLVYEVSKNFEMMGYDSVDHKRFGIELADSNNIHESLYMYGNDVVLFNIMLFDDGSDYLLSNKYEFKIKSSYIRNKISNITKSLCKNGISEDKIVTIITPTTIGRETISCVSLNTNKNLLMLSPYEIETICINETDENAFLYKYVTARNRLKHYNKGLFTELNFISLYSSMYNKSFYFGDDVDSKDSHLMYIGEYSSDYILESYKKVDKHLVNFNNYILHEVMKKEDGIYFSPALFIVGQFNYFLQFDKLNIWILGDKDYDYSMYDIYKLIIETIAYWLSNFKTIFNSANSIVRINIKCDSDMSTVVYNSNSEIGNIKFQMKSNEINIHFESGSMQRFKCAGNDAEKQFVSKIIESLCMIIGIPFPATLIDAEFKNPYRKKIVVMSSDDEEYPMPFREKNYLNISESISNLVLDDIGLYVRDNQHVCYGKIDDYKIINKIVGYLFEQIKSKIVKYNKLELLSFLYLEYEKNLTSLIYRQNNYSNDIACYPDKSADINEKIYDLNRTGVALKFIIELVSAMRFSGEKKISLYDLEYMVTECSKIIDFAFTCDIYNYGMAENTLKLLKSNRVGYDNTFMRRANDVLKKAKIDSMSATHKDKRKILNRYNSSDETIQGFEEAFLDEFGFSISTYTEVIMSLLDMAEQEDNTLNRIYVTTYKKIIDYIGEKIDSNDISNVLNYLMLSERDDYLDPTPLYRKEDVYPWRNNRKLSLSRKPLITFDNKILYGYRTLLNSVFFLFEIVRNGTFRASSDKMKKYMGLINEKRGNSFNEFVYNYLSSFSDSIVDIKVSKINGKKISDLKNNQLGDIDVLFISMKNKKIYVCEVKNFGLSKNMYELYNEFHDMFDFDNKKSYYNKHMKRVKWCKENLSDIIKQYKLPNKKWKVDYCFIVNEPLISHKTMKSNINVYTLDNLDKYLN